MNHQEDLYKLIKGMNSADTVRANVPRILDLWTPDVVLDITAKEALEGIYATYHLDGVVYAMQKELRTLTLLLAKRWTEVAEWTVDSYWKNLFELNEVYSLKTPELFNLVANQIIDFVIANQPEIEAAHFNDPSYQHKMRSWHTVKTDHSCYYRAMTNILISRGQQCPWSDDFLRSLYKGELRMPDQRTWVEFEPLPDVLKFEFAIEALNAKVMSDQDVTIAWIERKTSDDEQKIVMLITAAANGYTQAYAHLTDILPETAKQITIAQELELPVYDIIVNVLSSRQASSPLARLGEDVVFN